MTLDLDLSAAMQLACQAARLAGSILLSMKGSATVHAKSGKDLVTDADFAAQVAISNHLLEAYPDHDFLGEEGELGLAGSNPKPPKKSPYRWVVDPLDGTTNYAHGLPQYAVSIALTLYKEPILGVIYDPEADEMFSALKGQGALLNNKPIHTSQEKNLSMALVAAGLSPNLKQDSPEIQQVVRMLLACQGLRRLGSAALNLCYVACGRLDGYWGGTLKIWDIAAGVLIVRESGGVVSDFQGQDDQAFEGALIASATRQLQHSMQDTITKSN
jgi:myo-inositol-1(or 4)-monophosphatase